MISEARYLQLCKLINETRASWSVGVETNTLSDADYDKYMSEIYAYENIHKPAEDSPTVTINSTDNRTVQHPKTMLNFNKTHDLKAVSAFFRERHCIEVDIEPVIDGADIQLVYSKGELISVITFGDGKQGIECVHNARFVDDIPKKLDIVDLRNEVLIVSGVVYLTKKNHEKYCKEFGIQLNSRNLASNLIKRKYELHRAKYLSFKAYSLDNALTVADDDWDDIKQDESLEICSARRDCARGAYFSYAGTMNLIRRSLLPNRRPILYVPPPELQDEFKRRIEPVFDFPSKDEFLRMMQPRYKRGPLSPSKPDAQKQESDNHDVEVEVDV